MSYHNLAEVKEAHEAAGGMFFDPGWMRLFGTRLGRKLYGRRYFVTSELDHRRQDRRWTVRQANDDGTIITVGEFRQYATGGAANRAAFECFFEGLST